MRISYVCEGWRLDEKAAARALTHMRVMLNDKSEYMSDVSYEAVFGFLGSHGQCLNWVFRGDANGMICRAASRSPAALERIRCS